MQKTFFTRLRLSADQSELFEQLGLAYGAMKHALYREVAVGGGKCKSYKNEFLVEHSITARQFNALAVEVQGQIDSVTRLLEEEEKKLKQRLRKEKNALKAAQARARSVEKGKVWLSPAKADRLAQRLELLPKKIAKLEERLEEIKKRLKGHVPGICFGSRKLFNAQFHLEESGFESMEAWRTAWRKARSHQFFFVGSKDETAGNQSCTLSVLGPAEDPRKTRFSARIRLTDALAAERAAAAGSAKVLEPHKYAHVEFELGFGAAEVAASLGAGRALSYRFHRNNTTDEWTVFINTEVPPAPKISQAVGYGCLGVDFNADHLAVAEVNRHGNLLKSWTVEMDLEGKTAVQREEVLSLALKEVVSYAQAQKLAVVIEDLDFSAKKEDLRRKSKPYRRMLSGLFYAKYTELLRAKCAGAGIELIIVNPAYTSVMGRVRYAKPLGLSVHHAAAFVIGRRAMGCRERLPSVIQVVTGPRVSTLPLPARNRVSSKDKGWGAVAVDLRKTLHVVIRTQRLSDKRRFNNRQHSPP